MWPQFPMVRPKTFGVAFSARAGSADAIIRKASPNDKTLGTRRCNMVSNPSRLAVTLASPCRRPRGKSKNGLVRLFMTSSSILCTEGQSNTDSVLFFYPVFCITSLLHDKDLLEADYHIRTTLVPARDVDALRSSGRRMLR
jgi:hypothetical protein